MGAKQTASVPTRTRTRLTDVVTKSTAILAIKGLPGRWSRSEEHTSNSSHVAISYAVFCLKKITASTLAHKCAPTAPGGGRGAAHADERKHVEVTGTQCAFQCGQVPGVPMQPAGPAVPVDDI